MRWKLVGLSGLMLLSAILEMASLSLLLPLLQLVVAPNSELAQWILNSLNSFGFQSSADVLHIGIISFLLFFLIKNLVLLIIYFLQNRLIYTTLASFQIRLLRYYLLSPYTFYLQHNSAILLRNITSSLPTVFGGMLLSILTLLLEILLAVGVLTTLLLANFTATISTGALLGVAVGGLFYLTRHYLYSWGQQTQLFYQKQIQWTQQGLGALKEARILGREDYFSDVFSEHSLELSRVHVKVSVFNQIPRLYMEMVMLMGITLLGVVLAMNVQEISEIVPVIGLFAVAAVRLTPSMGRILQSANSIKGSAAAMEHVFLDLKNAAELVVSEEIDSPPIHDFSQIRFEDVNYTYPASDKPALKEITMVIDRGDALALVGPSGSGKTTLSDLLLGLLEVKSGLFLLDDHSVYDNLGAWQRCIGYVPQDIYLLDDTLRRNIAFGIKDEFIDEEMLASAIRLSNLGQVVEELPQKLDTKLGEHGVRLSGGQRQRVGIARALYHDPQVLVLDEATSALDNETEREITEAIEAFSGEKTLIIIAHRLSTVRHCDRLVFMRNGRIDAEGSFDELLANNVHFQKMAQLGMNDSNCMHVKPNNN